MAYKYNYSIKLTISGHVQSLLSSAGILSCCVDGKQEKQKIVGNVMFTLLRARTLFNFLSFFQAWNQLSVLALSHISEKI